MFSPVHTRYKFQSNTTILLFFKTTFKATCFGSTEPLSGLLMNTSNINIYSAFWGLKRPDDGFVELKHVALNVFRKIKGLLCLTEICTLYELENTSGWPALRNILNKRSRTTDTPVFHYLIWFIYCKCSRYIIVKQITYQSLCNVSSV